MSYTVRHMGASLWLLALSCSLSGEAREEDKAALRSLLAQESVESCLADEEPMMLGVHLLLLLEARLVLQEPLEPVGDVI